MMSQQQPALMVVVEGRGEGQSRSKMRAALTLLFLVTVVGVAMFAAAPGCLRGGRDCLSDAECCGGCCDGGRCVDNSERCLRGAANACAASQLQCPPGKSCRPQQVSCVAAPCDPVPACVSDGDAGDYDYQQ